MLEPIEMLKLYNEAKELDIVTDLSKDANCNSECDDCPANPACKQLSDISTHNFPEHTLFVDKQGYGYKLFKQRYREQILPLVEEQLKTD